MAALVHRGSPHGIPVHVRFSSLLPFPQFCHFFVCVCVLVGSVGGPSHKCDACARLVDLPDVELLVLVQRGLELCRGEATRDTPLLSLGELHQTTSAASPANTLACQLTHQGEDHVSWPLRSAQTRHTGRDVKCEETEEC